MTMGNSGTTIHGKTTTTIYSYINQKKKKNDMLQLDISITTIAGEQPRSTTYRAMNKISWFIG